MKTKRVKSPKLNAKSKIVQTTSGKKLFTDATESGNMIDLLMGDGLTNIVGPCNEVSQVNGGKSCEELQNSLRVDLTQLRSTMSNDRLNGLALLSIHYDIFIFSSRVIDVLLTMIDNDD